MMIAATRSSANVALSCCRSRISNTQIHFQSRCIKGRRLNVPRRKHDDGLSNESSLSRFRHSLREFRSNGVPEMMIGAVILTIVGIDYILRGRNDERRADTIRQLEREIRSDAEKSRKEDEDRINDGAMDQCLFQCIVRRVPEILDGHRCLTNVKVGDVLDVVEEGVGPGQQYNLCSIRRSPPGSYETNPPVGDVSGFVSIGWFPCSCLEKMDESIH